jgi:Protein of unknown function (DUF2490)
MHARMQGYGPGYPQTQWLFAMTLPLNRYHCFTDKGFRRRIVRRLPKATNVAAMVCALLRLMPAVGQAGEAEDKAGNWLIYNGTIQFSDQWSMFIEAQLRLWEVSSNVNETFIRAAGQYHMSPGTLAALGYMRSKVEPFEDETPGTTENRLYEQFTGKHRWGRPLLEHRLRLEQRWIEETGETSYRNRFRYRLQVTMPLDRPTIEPRSHFLNFYNEVFLNFGNKNDTFDQNRLYGAYGYQFTKYANLQIGLLWQARKSADFYRLQIFYTHNFDLGKTQRPRAPLL